MNLLKQLMKVVKFLLRFANILVFIFLLTFSLNFFTPKLESKVSNASEEQAVASYQVEFKGQTKQVLPNGKLVDKEKNGPIIQLNEQLAQACETTQQVPTAWHQKFLELNKGLQANQLSPDLVKVNQEFIVLQINGKQVLLFDELPTNLKRLQLILEKYNFAQAETEIKEIDLRFKLPILRSAVTQ